MKRYYIYYLIKKAYNVNNSRTLALELFSYLNYFYVAAGVASGDISGDISGLIAGDAAGGDGGAVSVTIGVVVTLGVGVGVALGSALLHPASITTANNIITKTTITEFLFKTFSSLDLVFDNVF